MEILNILLIAVIIIIVIILFSYNKLVKLSNRVKKEEADIDIILNKRFDLIPNIVECVKGYAKHESDTLEKVVLDRNTYRNSDNLDLTQAKKVNTEFNKILALAESYPDLKANEQFINLQRQLSIIENELTIERSEYNAIVTRYNTALQTIPSNIVAKMFGFEIEDLFTIDDEKRENVKIKI